MAVGSKKLVIEILADANKAHRGFQAVIKSSDTMGRRVKRAALVAGTALASMAAAAAIGLAYLGVKVVKMAAQFEESMNKIRGLVGASAKDMALYEDAVLSMAGKVGKSAMELSEALYFVTSSGFSGAKAVKVLERAATASAAGLGDTKVVADALTTALNVYRKENLKAAKATDIMVAAVREGKMEPEEMAENLGKVLSMAKLSKVGFEEVAGALAAMSLAGGDTAEASVALNQFFTVLAKETPKSVAALEDMGLTFKGLREVIAERGLLAGMTLFYDKALDTGDALGALTKALGNVRAARAVLQMMSLDGEQLAGIMKRVANSTGDTDEAFRKVGEGTMFKFKKASEGLNTILIRIGSAALPVINDLLDVLAGNYLPRFSEWVKTHRKQIREFFRTVGQKIGDAAQATGRFLEQLEGLLSWVNKHGGTILRFFNALADAAAAMSMGSGLLNALGGDGGDGNKPAGSGGGKTASTQHPKGPKGRRPRATGGIVSGPEYSLLGEAGPEAVIPLTRPRRAAEVMAQAGLGGGPTFQNCSFYGAPMDDWLRKLTKAQSVRATRLARGVA